MATKNAEHASMEMKLKQLGAQLDSWKLKGEKAAAEAKVEYHKRLVQYKKAKAKVQALKAPTTSALSDLKAGANKAIQDLSQSFRKAKSEFN